MFKNIKVIGLYFFFFISLCMGALSSSQAAAAEKNAQSAPANKTTLGEIDPHADVFAETNYPSATTCASCHPKVYWEWAASNHAYASVSPMFHKFEQAVNDLTSGTMGTFCVRCHQQVGTQRGEAREQPLWERSATSREGVTCITCHRVGQEFGKVNGERHISPGDSYAPVYNAGKGTVAGLVIQDNEYYRVSTKPGEPGRKIHMGAIRFDQINKSEFCVSCHQVQVNLGIKLEVVWDQYRDSPAAKKGVTCQECHMGKVPGHAEGYETWPIAIVNGRVVGDTNSKHSNHMFYGPGYPIAHPGVFPFNQRALKWSIQDWLKFNYRSAWGQLAWEDRLKRGEIEKQVFPSPWEKVEDRIAARNVIDQNLKLLEDKRKTRLQVMANGSRLDGPFFTQKPKHGNPLTFNYKVTNIDKGHNLPSGSLGAQPEIWLNVALIDPDGQRVWESGYVDSRGDMADIHSLDVAQNKIKYDDQLFNLQTKFLTTNIKGTDREMYLPINFDVDQLPMLRPADKPTSVLNHPPNVRMEGRSIPPEGSRDAQYKIPANLMKKTGKYKLQARLRSRAEPIYFMEFVGATEDMKRSINDWMIDIHPQASEFVVN